MCTCHPLGWLRAGALTCCPISLVGVRWSYLRIDKQAISPFRRGANCRGGPRSERERQGAARRQRGQGGARLYIHPSLCTPHPTPYTPHPTPHTPHPTPYRGTSLMSTPPTPKDHHMAVGICYCRFLCVCYCRHRWTQRRARAPRRSEEAATARRY